MPSEARQKIIMEKLNRAQKCSILGPQNLGSRGGPLDPRLICYILVCCRHIEQEYPEDKSTKLTSYLVFRKYPTHKNDISVNTHLANFKSQSSKIIEKEAPQYTD